MLRNFIYLVLVSALFWSCKMPVPQFQKVVAVPNNAWTYSFKPKFTYDITDTMGHYVPYFIIRHTQGYPYCNAWLLFYVKTPGDTIARRERININMAESSGKWLGRGMGEIYEERVRLNLGDSVKLNKAGTYEVTIEQNMRIDPLPEVMQVGFRIEKQGVVMQKN